MSTFKLDDGYALGGYNSAALPIVTDANTWIVYSKDGVLKMPNPTMKLGTIGMNEKGMRIIYTAIKNTANGSRWFHAGEYLHVDLNGHMVSEPGAADDPGHGYARPMMGTSADGIVPRHYASEANAVMLQDIRILAGETAAFWAGFDFIPRIVWVTGTAPGSNAATGSDIFTHGTQILAPQILPFRLFAGVIINHVTGTFDAPGNNRVQNSYIVTYSTIAAGARNAQLDRAAKEQMAIQGICVPLYAHA
jgi:hypothetical protein